MVETFFGFKKTPFSDSPDAKQLFASQSWTQLKARLQFLVDHHGAGLLTGEVGSGKSTAARSFTAALNPNLFKVMYLHWTPGSTLDLLRQTGVTSSSTRPSPPLSPTGSSRIPKSSCWAERVCASPRIPLRRPSRGKSAPSKRRAVR